MSVIFVYFPLLQSRYDVSPFHIISYSLAKLFSVIFLELLVTYGHIHKLVSKVLDKIEIKIYRAFHNHRSILYQSFSLLSYYISF